MRAYFGAGLKEWREGSSNILAGDMKRRPHFMDSRARPLRRRSWVIDIRAQFRCSRLQLMVNSPRPMGTWYR